MLQGSAECGHGRLALGLRAAAAPSTFLNAATSRSSCSRRALCCDIVPTLRMLAPVVIDQSLADPRRRRHVRALSRVLPDDALAFFQHTALQPPMAVDGGAGGSGDAGLECDIDIDDGDGEEATGVEASGKELEMDGASGGAVSNQHVAASVATVEEARAACDSALDGASAAAAAAAAEQAATTANDFTNCVHEGGGGGEGSAAAAEQITTNP